jgi:hypothetical protein
MHLILAKKNYKHLNYLVRVFRNATKRQLEGLAHVWRVMGYYLGMPDESNFVQNSFVKTQSTISEMFDCIFVQAILRSDHVSMVMGKNIATAMGIDYHVMMYQSLLREYFLLQTNVKMKLFYNVLRY